MREAGQDRFVIDFPSPFHLPASDVKARTAKRTMAKLDDLQLKTRLVIAVENGMTTAQAAAHVGLTRQTVRNYGKSHPDFQLELDTARDRRQQVAHHAPRMLPVGPKEAGRPYSRDELLALVWAHANDPESKACPKALGILAEYELGAEVRAKIKAAERAADADTGGTVRRVCVEMPRPGSKSVIDAEVVET